MLKVVECFLLCFCCATAKLNQILSNLQHSYDPGTIKLLRIVLYLLIIALLIIK